MRSLLARIVATTLLVVSIGTDSAADNGDGRGPVPCRLGCMETHVACQRACRQLAATPAADCQQVCEQQTLLCIGRCDARVK